MILRIRLTVAAGAWLLVAPLALSYPTTGVGFRAHWNDVLVGIAVIAFAVPRLASPDRTAVLTPVSAVLGGWLVAAPFLLGFSGTRAGVNDVLVGALLVLLAVPVRWWLRPTGLSDGREGRKVSP